MARPTGSILHCDYEGTPVLLDTPKWKISRDDFDTLTETYLIAEAAPDDTQPEDEWAAGTQHSFYTGMYSTGEISVEHFTYSTALGAEHRGDMIATVEWKGIRFHPDTVSLSSAIAAKKARLRIDRYMESGSGESIGSYTYSDAGGRTLVTGPTDYMTPHISCVRSYVAATSPNITSWDFSNQNFEQLGGAIGVQETLPTDLPAVPNDPWIDLDSIRYQYPYRWVLMRRSVDHLIDSATGLCRVVDEWVHFHRVVPNFQ